MICPYCNNQMKKGEVQSTRMIYWQPEEATAGVNKIRYSKHGVEKHGGMVLSPPQMNIISKPLIGYHCSSCKKVIIDY
ncbi:MAG: PF20097 family protein [Zhenhengia sp.]|uniref:PF20097 family protein n=1 Tax=Zhenhengia sp. TaxID=2944208 RepID=UPI0039945CA0